MKPKSPRGRLIFIVGPTAAGKSEIAFKLAKRIKGEIISCDSMQIYRRMNIMNQCPPSGRTRLVRHYLAGVLEPGAEYSAAQFRKKALGLVERVIKKGKIPIIAGGSGLYMKALLDGLFPSPRKDTRLRQKLLKKAELIGAKGLHAELKSIDPEAASKIHPNDLRRIIRALEVYYLTGLPISRHKKRTEGIASKYDIRIFGIRRPREKLYERINKRVEKMFKDGLVKEVKGLSGRRLSITAKASLGYKEVFGYLKGEYGPDEAKELLKRNTRRYAKRQLSWFRADKRIEWLDVDRFGVDGVVDEIWKRHY